MVDPQDTRKPAETVWELLRKKFGIKPPAPPASPEASHFKKPEPDREEERKQAARSRQDGIAQQETVEAKDRARLEQAFAPASLSDEIKLDQRIAAITHEECREAAKEAREDAWKILEENKSKINQVLEKDRKFYDRYDLTKPVSEFTSGPQNKDRDEELERLYRAQIATKDLMERTIANAEKQSYKLTPQITHQQPHLTHQAAQPTTPAGWLTETHRAAASLSPSPKPPGMGVSA